jgi:NAD(P)-dependent dehydrogenase (short-subunit alcohol dehydrogenase family)
MTNSDQRKVAFVTGGASGMGRATAEAFLQRGYAVAIVDINEAEGREAEAELGALGPCIFVACNVADDESVRRAVERTVETYGRLDAAFNAAGIEGEQGKAAADTSLENWRKVMSIDLDGIWYCMRHQIPQMLKSGGGAIVNCASTAGLFGAPMYSAYVAAKHGVMGLTRAAALDYASKGIRINAICPAMIDTPMVRRGITPELLEQMQKATPVGRMGQPSEIASAVMWLCDDSSGFVIGQAIVVDGGFTVM